MKQYQQEEHVRSERRQESMKLNHERKKAMREKVAKERDQLSHQHLITSSGELMDELEKLDVCKGSKKRKKLALIRKQINIRKKVLNQKIAIPFTHHGKDWPLAVIVKEVTEFITMNPQVIAPSPPTSDPHSLVGKNILHKFILESGEVHWFGGVIVAYNPETQTHEVAYNDEEEHQFFDLTEDIFEEDLKFIDD